MHLTKHVGLIMVALVELRQGAQALVAIRVAALSSNMPTQIENPLRNRASLIREAIAAPPSP